jgi:hypothetical protein
MFSCSQSEWCDKKQRSHRVTYESDVFSFTAGALHADILLTYILLGNVLDATAYVALTVDTDLQLLVPKKYLPRFR